MDVEISCFSPLSPLIVFDFVQTPLCRPIFFIDNFKLRWPGVLPGSCHASNSSGLLRWSTHYLCRPVFELSNTFIPLQCLEPHLSIWLLELEKMVQKDRCVAPFQIRAIWARSWHEPLKIIGRDNKASDCNGNYIMIFAKINLVLGLKVIKWCDWYCSLYTYV